MIFSRYNSPVSQDFIWVAEYTDGNYLAEFDFKTQEESSFYTIRRDRLLRFGLVGYGAAFYFEVPGGIFKLAGRMVEFIYKVDGREYYLTGQQHMYNDIITFKDAEAMADLQNGRFLGNRITQYNFGYKTVVNFDGIGFNFKPVVKIPFQQSPYVNVRLVASEGVDGILIIRVNNRDVFQILAPLKKEVGGEINWVLK